MEKNDAVSVENRKCEEKNALPEVINNNAKKRKLSVVRENSKLYGKWIRGYLKEYCSLTTIHGCKYLGEDRSYFEKLRVSRIWWIVILTVSLIGCLLMINKIYTKWQNTPVIVTFATTETPISKLPFPAITICPETKIKADEFNFTRTVHKMQDGEEWNEDEYEGYKHFSLVCDSRNYSSNYSDHNKTIGDEFFAFIEEKTPDFLNESLCSWMNYKNVCYDFFTPLITDEGICYTFNMLDRKDFYTDSVKFIRYFLDIEERVKDWNTATFSYNYEKEMDKDRWAYPYRAFLPGAKVAFSIMMPTRKQDVDYLCKDSFQGFRVLLHHPSTMPKLSDQFFRVALDQSVTASVQPIVMTTSESLKNYEPENRRCYFSHERKLKFFQVYTQENCETECTANFTKSICSCTPFHMPRETDTEICGGGSKFCLDTVQDYVFSLKIGYEQPDKEKYPPEIQKANISVFDCNCLPGCSSTDYNVEISQSDWNWRKQFGALRSNELEIMNVIHGDHVSKLEIFIKSSHIIAMERHELYGRTDFIANCGGLLGLFTGFSIVSFMEIIYFCTLRLFYNTYNKSNKRSN